MYPKLRGLECNQSPLWDRSVLFPHFTLQEIGTRGQETGPGPQAQQWQRLARTRPPKPTPHPHGQAAESALQAPPPPHSQPRTQNLEPGPQTQRLHQPRREEGSCPQLRCSILTHSHWGSANTKNHKYSCCLFKSVTLSRSFPGGPVVKTPRSLGRGLGGSLVRKLDPCVITKTWRSQTN